MIRRILGPGLVAFAVAAALVACGGESGTVGTAGSGAWEQGVHLEAEPFESGDAEQGRHTLLNGGYMSCGIPYKLWVNELSGGTAQGMLTSGSEEAELGGREGRNADLPHDVNAFTTAGGIEVVNANCLQCHGGRFNGEFVLGLGNATADFTGGDSDASLQADYPPELLRGLGLDEAEIAEFEKLLGRVAKVLPQTRMRTVGHNPAEMFAVILMLHHDRDTLAWSDEAVLDGQVVDAAGEPIAEPLVTSDPPPWWRAHKKNALFYNGMARGDHRGTMMLATSLCVDNLEDAARVDRDFVDIQEFIRTVRPPAYPFDIDAALAEAGEPVFAEHCAGCHGTYVPAGQDEAEETYPNLLIPLDVIGTDPVVANAGVVHAPDLVPWYNGSFYGQVTRMEPKDPATGVVGYVPPPLDGIWATAPYLHNGSVPTLAQLLNSPTRPKAWRRDDYDSANFDQAALGWPHTAITKPQSEAPEPDRKHIYDTRHWSQSNAGHTFGDALTAEERRALLEYLKTL